MANELISTKYVSICPPAAIVDNAALTTAEIDTLGYDWLTVVVYLGATDIAMVALTMTESDTAGSGHANVTGLVYGTSTNIAGSTSALPSATDDNKFFLFEVDLRARKRYLDCSCTIGDGTAGGFTAILGILSRAADAPVTAAERGCGDILRV